MLLRAFLFILRFLFYFLREGILGENFPRCPSIIVKGARSEIGAVCVRGCVKMPGKPRARGRKTIIPQVLNQIALVSNFLQRS